VLRLAFAPASDSNPSEPQNSTTLATNALAAVCIRSYATLFVFFASYSERDNFGLWICIRFGGENCGTDSLCRNGLFYVPTGSGIFVHPPFHPMCRLLFEGVDLDRRELIALWQHPSCVYVYTIYILLHIVSVISDAELAGLVCFRIRSNGRTFLQPMTAPCLP